MSELNKFEKNPSLAFSECLCQEEEDGALGPEPGKLPSVITEKK